MSQQNIPTVGTKAGRKIMIEVDVNYNECFDPTGREAFDSEGEVYSYECSICDHTSIKIEDKEATADMYKHLDTHGTAQILDFADVDGDYEIINDKPYNTEASS